MKKNLHLLPSMIIILLVLIIANVSATEIKKENLKYHASCVDSPDGLHHMDARGGVNVISATTGKLLFNDAMLSKCKYCNKLLITEGNVFLGEKVYHYCSDDKINRTKAWDTVSVDYDSIDEMPYENSYTLEGYKFNY